MQTLPENLDYSQAEHICLEDDSPETASSAISEIVEYRLQLKRRTHGSEQNIPIYDSGRIEVDFSQRKAEPCCYRIDAHNLDASPLVVRHVARGTLITALVTGAASTLLLALPLWFTPFGAWQSPVGILLATMGLFALLLGVYRTGETVSFASLHGRVPIITVHGGIRCHKYCATLSEVLGTVTAAVRNETDVANLLRNEMREHHRLKVEGVIEDQDFETAKLRILSAHG
jgi:hypothetical protein